MNENTELYYKDAYLKEFDAVVTGCAEGKTGFEITLSKTAFYPEGGGQPGDTGTLNGTAVTDTRSRNDVIVHITEQPIAVGTPVHGIICWQRRFDLMQQHSGEHIFSGIVHEFFGYDNIGFHLGEDTITLDFSGPLTWEDLRRVEDKANEIIWRNTEVEVSYPDEQHLHALAYRSKKELEGTVRIVSIADADVCACCGTHVRSAGEIGLIKVLSCAARKSGTRVEIVCGKRALCYCQTVCDENRRISHLLSAKVNETSAAVERMQKELIDTTYKMRGIILNELYSRLPEIEMDLPLYVYFAEGVDSKELLKFANLVNEERHARISAAFTKKDDHWHYVIISKSTDLRPLSRQLNEMFSGRGGGNRELIQGSLCGAEGEIKEALEQMCAGL